MANLLNIFSHTVDTAQFYLFIKLLQYFKQAGFSWKKKFRVHLLAFGRKKEYSQNNHIFLNEIYFSPGNENPILKMFQN